MWIVATGQPARTAAGSDAFHIRNWPKPLALDGLSPEPAAKLLSLEVLIDGDQLSLRARPLPLGAR